ncbi:MAG: ATP-binding cassette domain-containing protein, partial [Deltaproteobacteria bacterium]|nr:ATP-binding cassette domain-containing protein [Deltaproteobacteria bacterium]
MKVEDLWFAYNGVWALREVNLEVPRGDFLALIGPNGGGKTTFLKLLLGLLKPDRGQIRVLGQKPGRQLLKVGYAPQDRLGHDDLPLTVMEAVLMGRLGQPGRLWRYSPADRAEAEKALVRVGLADFRRRRLRRLSGGQ